MSKSAHTIAQGHRLIVMAAFSLAVLIAGLYFARAVEAQEAGDTVVEARTPLTAAELEELAGPIALYPDDLVSIVLPASTYPLQIVQAARYLEAHETDPALKPDESWDDSVVALLNYPEVIEMMNEDLDWTRALGEAAVYQQAELLDAIQVFRERAYAAGNLKSDEHQVVTKEEDVIVIEPADPKVIYVPRYEPEVVIVRHVYPVYRYYPRAYPVYYYPYPYGHSFAHGLFWGLALAFTIDWHAHHVHVYHHSHHAHPFYGHYYHYPFYKRHAIRVAYRDHVWRPRHHHHFRHGHAVARVKAKRRIEATLASRSTHRSRLHGSFSALAIEAPKRAKHSKSLARGRDKSKFVTREHAKPRKRWTQRENRAARHSQRAARVRTIEPRIDKLRPEPKTDRTGARHSSRAIRSKRLSRGRPEWSQAPRQKIERSATHRRGARGGSTGAGSGARGARTFAGAAPPARAGLRPRSSGRLKSGKRSGIHKRSGFSARADVRSRSGFGGGDRRHLR